MKIRILGPLQVETDSGQSADLGPPKQRALLALLAISPNAVLSTDRIIDALWGEDPATERERTTSVYVYVSRLREVLEPGRAKRSPGRVIVTEPSGYSLRIAPEDIDANEFEHLVSEARRQVADHPEDASDLIEQALRLWRDHPLSDVRYEDFVQGEIRRLGELRLQALEIRYEAAGRTGDTDAVIPELERLIAEHPLRERLVALLMESLANSGRQPEALRAFRGFATHLAEETGLEPSTELRRLEERILLGSDGDPEDERTAEPQPHSRLPVRLTSLVGRTNDVARVAATLETARLLTLTGPGGVGKTSLAIEIAREAEARFPGGVWLVDLAALQDPIRVAITVADALDVASEPGVTPAQSVARALGDEPSLLLLDNCEHLVDTVAGFCSDILQANPRLKILCTSRRSLALEGESVYEVEPLPLPPLEADVESLQGSPSAQLLLERASAAAPGFSITTANAADVVALCRRLDGIPLAIELAASNLRSMAVMEIAHSLRDRLELAGRRRTVARHQTLRATMQWSYDLLRESEQHLFDLLSLFAGPFSRKAALAVGGQEEAPAAELATLVEASMIAADVSGPAAEYRMLPTMRDFGVFNLRERGTLEDARRSHAGYLESLASTVDLPVAMTSGTTPIAAHVSFADFSAAADWALQTGQHDLAIKLLVVLGYHWINGGRLDDAAHWLGRVHELAGLETSLDAWKLRLIAAQLDWFAGRNEKAEEEFRLLSAQALQMGEPYAAADAQQFAAYVRWRSGDLRGARDDMAVASATAADEPGQSMLAREGVAVLELYLGNPAAASEHLEVLEAFAERTGHPIARCNALNTRGWLACYSGEMEDSVHSFAQCRDIAAEQGDWHHDVNARLGLAWVLPAMGRPKEALAAGHEARELAANAANAGKLAEALIVTGLAHLDLGDTVAAAGSIAEGLETLRARIRRVDHMTRALRLGGWVALAVGDALPAYRFMTAAEAEHRRIGFVDPPADAARSARHLRAAAAMLSAAEREACDQDPSSFMTIIGEGLEYLRRLSA